MPPPKSKRKVKRRAPKSPEQVAASQRNFLIFRLRGAYGLADEMEPSLGAEFKSIIDRQLRLMKADTESMKENQ